MLGMKCPNDTNLMRYVLVGSYHFYHIGSSQCRKRQFSVNSFRPSEASVNKPSLIQIMACLPDGANPLSEPMLEYC